MKDLPEVPIIPGLEIRFTENEDAKFMREWFIDPTLARSFPMSTIEEIDDAVSRWISFAKLKCSLTAVMNGVPCGIATLYLQPYRKLIHQCEFGIILGKDFRGAGVGGALMIALMRLAKEQFRIELIHMQVHSENPAIKFYQRYGFREYGRQNMWMREEGSYIGRVYMERFL